MFSIIITEKGGSERRESYDRAEINVGRVQGNDLMLPKGNVSKRHARLLFRDGRFIVTDLKSTNGTYVNGRKIAQATIVREGDKIYIGDFVLRIETQGAAAGPTPSHEGHQPAPSQPEASEPGVSDVARSSPRAPSMPSIDSQPAVSPRIGQVGPQGAPSSGGADGVSYFPLDRDPDEGGYGSVPSPPRVPSPAGPSPARATAPPAAAARVAPQSTHLGTGAPSPIHQPGGPAASAPPPSPGAAGPHTAAAGSQGSAPQGAPPGAPGGPGSGGLAPGQGVLGQGVLGQGVLGQGVPGQGNFAHGAAGPGSLAPGAPSPALTTPAPAPAGMVQGSMAAGPLVAPMATPRIEPATLDHGRGVSGAPPSLPSSSAVPPPNAAAFPPVPPSAQRRSPSSDDRPQAADAARTALRRQLVANLVGKAESHLDLGPVAGGDSAPPALVESTDRALREAAASLADAPSGPELELAIADARRELLALGPLGPLLDDEDVTEVQIVRHDHVVAAAGRRTIISELAFSTEASFERVLHRLCARSGRPLGPDEVFVDRRLDRMRLFAVIGRRDGSGTMVTLRKPQRADQTLDDLVRAGAVSRVVASFLGQAVASRANVLVTGGHGSGATTLLGALAAAGSTEDRIVVLQEDDEIVFNQPHTVSILLGDTAEAGAQAVRAALRAHPDRLVVGAFAGHVVTEVIDAVGDGVEGVMAAARAPTLRQLASRLPADIAATRGGISLEVAREWLASSFDLAVEVAKLRDGRMRVLRVAELAHEGGQIVVKDVFAFVVERMAAGGAVEGSFASTGHVPRIAEDLAQRGTPVDPALFKPTSKGGGPQR